LVVVWLNEETQDSPAVWMVSDSRISSDGATPIDEGAKLFSLPIVCRGPDRSGHFTEPYFAQSIGMAGVVHALIYHHVYATLVPILNGLIGAPDSVPSLEDIAATVAKITTVYVASLGQNRRSDAHQVTLSLDGYCILHARYEAYRCAARFSDAMFERFEAVPLDLDGGRPHFFGDHIEVAHAAVENQRSEDPPPIVWHRSPQFVVRRFIEDPQYTTIGGDLQIGRAAGLSFVRGSTASPRVHGEPEVVLRVNNIDLEQVGMVGPCMIGITGMTG
jgi:hypothetical protein